MLFNGKAAFFVGCSNTPLFRFFREKHVVGLVELVFCLDDWVWGPNVGDGW